MQTFTNVTRRTPLTGTAPIVLQETRVRTLILSFCKAMPSTKQTKKTADDVAHGFSRIKSKKKGVFDNVQKETLFAPFTRLTKCTRLKLTWGVFTAILLKRAHLLNRNV